MSKVAKVVAALKVDELTERQGRAEHKRLADEIGRHDRPYHDMDAPEISDADYHKLRQRLQALEARSPQLADADSPTERVALPPPTALTKLSHAKPSQSLDK